LPVHAEYLLRREFGNAAFFVVVAVPPFSIFSRCQDASLHGRIRARILGDGADCEVYRDTVLWKLKIRCTVSAQKRNRIQRTCLPRGERACDGVHLTAAAGVSVVPALVC
jgi:hypothetical protein